jgi:hypothetical protein
MKVKISDYPTHYGTEHIAKALLFWLPEEHPLVNRLDNWLMGYDPKQDYTPEIGSCYDNWEGSWLHRTLNAINVWRDNHRTIKVHIDRWDTVNMNSTLTVLILPMLKQLKVRQKGCTLVDNADVPVEMFVDEDSIFDGTEDNHEMLFKRWAWVMDEMINAFEKLNNEDWDKGFFAGEMDKDVWLAEKDRIANGLRLFGVYFEGLWQ